MLDVEDLDDDVDIDTPVKTVIPTQGAVVVARYSTRVGHRVLVSLTSRGPRFLWGDCVYFDRKRYRRYSRRRSLSLRNTERRTFDGLLE